jgi:hypothetical protein
VGDELANRRGHRPGPVAIRPDDESIGFVDTVDHSDGGFESGVELRTDRDDGFEVCLRTGCGQLRSVDVVDVTKRLPDRRIDATSRIEQSERPVADDLDPTVVEIEPDLVGQLAKIRAIEQLDGVGIAGRPQFLNVLLRRRGKSTRRHDHPAFRSVEIVSCDRGVELLHHWPTDRVRVFALDDDRPTRPIDDLLHGDVSSLVGCTTRLLNVLVAEVAEHVLHQILEHTGFPVKLIE